MELPTWQHRLCSVFLFLFKCWLNPLPWIIFMRRSLSAYACFKLTISSQFCQAFSPQTSRKCPYSHPLHVCDSNYTHALTSLQLSQLLAGNHSSRLGKSFTAKNGCPTRWEDSFLSLFVHRRTETAHPMATRCFQSWDQRWPCCLHPSGASTHLPLSHLLTQMLSLEKKNKKKTLCKVTSQDESFIPSTATAGKC